MFWSVWIVLVFIWLLCRMANTVGLFIDWQGSRSPLVLTGSHSIFEDILRQSNANSMVQLNVTRSWHMTRLLLKMWSLPLSPGHFPSHQPLASHSDLKRSSSVFRCNRPRWDNSTWTKPSCSFNTLVPWAAIASYLTALVLVKWMLGRSEEDITEKT